MHALGLVGSLLIAACMSLFSPAMAVQPPVIRLATTTSTDSSGLLQVLLPPFEKQTGYKVHVIAVGTGKALRLARTGDVDVVLVHARPAEDKLVAEGAGVERRDVMYNDFIIVGPERDPAHLHGLSDAVQALKSIAAGQHTFLSRGDDSGTHKKEKQLWQTAGITPEGKWYREAGQGMGKVLQIAGELDAYTLTDRGTWLYYAAKSPLRIQVAGDVRLYNPYGVIAVNPQRYPDANYAGAMALIAWLTSPEGQALIGEYRIHGQRLFVPMAVSR